MDDRPGRGAAVGRDTSPAVSRGNRNQRLLIVGAVVLAAGLMIRIFASRQHGERVSAAGGAEVYYRAPVTRETATRLARFLEAKGVFS
ncbi:MAG: hypothetical protein KC503_07995, partial [Myxococcales bacterium]|nr:hypothetical protein [Myxococcales bacterium]